MKEEERGQLWDTWPEQEQQEGLMGKLRHAQSNEPLPVCSASRSQQGQAEFSSMEAQTFYRSNTPPVYFQCDIFPSVSGNS